jgi:hypothetical protein
LKQIKQIGHFIDCKFDFEREKLVSLSAVNGQFLTVFKDNHQITIVQTSKYK